MTATNDDQPPMGPEAQYFTDLIRGEFRIQRCQSCTKAVHPPRIVCPFCASEDLVKRTPSGMGTVYSATIVRMPKDKGGDFNVSLIDLAEGPRMMSRVESIAPADVKIGMSVRARITQNDDGALLVFDPEGAAL